MRLDLLLVRLRFVSSRGLAQGWINAGHIRRNAVRVTKPSQPVEPGDVLTLPMGANVSLIEILALPQRRGPASEALEHYRVLDAGRILGIAETARGKRDEKAEGTSPP